MGLDLHPCEYTTHRLHFTEIGLQFAVVFLRVGVVRSEPFDRICRRRATLTHSCESSCSKKGNRQRFGLTSDALPRPALLDQLSVYGETFARRVSGHVVRD